MFQAHCQNSVIRQSKLNDFGKHAGARARCRQRCAICGLSRIPSQCQTSPRCDRGYDRNIDVAIPHEIGTVSMWLSTDSFGVTRLMPAPEFRRPSLPGVITAGRIHGEFHLDPGRWLSTLGPSRPPCGRIMTACLFQTRPSCGRIQTTYIFAAQMTPQGERIDLTRRKKSDTCLRQTHWEGRRGFWG